MISRLAKIVTTTTLAVASLSAANYFPLETGNTWTYRNNVTGQTFTVRVSLPVMVNDTVYYTLQGYVGSNIMVRVDEHDTLVYVDNETNQERPLISFVPFEGGWWNAPYRACEQESQTQEKRGAYDGPAGEFREVLNVRFRSFDCADAGTQLEQFSENIGMLRRIEQSFAGPQQYDLVYARIGKMVIDALPTGRFAVTLDQVNGSEAVIAVLRLRLNDQPIHLKFPTAQEFDIVLRDEEGKAVWTWSDGKFFDQAAHDRSVVSEWTIAVPMPRPGERAAKPEQKMYTLHAWLTTEGPAPGYAATVPVTIAAPSEQ
jgi:hypothetical protein